MTFEQVIATYNDEWQKYAPREMPAIYQLLYKRHFAKYKDLYKRFLLFKCNYCKYGRHIKRCEDYEKRRKTLYPS